MSVSRPGKRIQNADGKFDSFVDLYDRRQTKMDPRAHAMAMEQVGQGILAVAEQEEKRLDAQLKGLENLGRTCSVLFRLLSSSANQHILFVLDEDDFEALRQKRRLMLQKKMKLEQDWKQMGHGR